MLTWRYQRYGYRPRAVYGVANGYVQRRVVNVGERISSWLFNDIGA
jgi:hypothetical protein